MAVIEDLTEEEAYLWAILQDESGLDIAEFCWEDPEQDDNCFRAWAFQWSWWRCNDPLQIDQCARSVGKSLSIKVRAFAFPFLHPGQEMVITGPEGVHVDAITDLIETAFFNTRLGNEMLVKGVRGSVKHKPFHMNFANGARIMGRIPQRDGKGVKGIHPLWLELDEAQDYPELAWVEVTETLKRGSEGAVWRAHGVTKGVRDTFFQNTKPESQWTVHQYTAMHRPTWSDEERQEKIEQYHGRDDPDYRRNVLGAHGDAMSPIFVLHRLMAAADDDQGSPYNIDEYQHYRISHEWMLERGMENIVQALDFPEFHRSRYKTFWAGMDVGYTNHPSEILIFGEENPDGNERNRLKKKGKACPPDGETRLKLLTRINLTRVGVTQQENAILWVVDFYRPRAFSMDKTGNGLPLFQKVQERNRQESVLIKGYGFSEKLLVDFDQSVEIDPLMTKEEIAREAGIKRTAPEYATDILRTLVDDGRLWLPWDEDILGEFMGQTYKITKTSMDQYGKREYSMGKFHAFDAARMAVLGWKQYGIESLMREEDQAPVFDNFVVF